MQSIGLSAAERRFIREHSTDDVRQLVLRAASGRVAGPNAADVDVRKVAAQIAARQKARLKLPTWYADDTLVFPPALSVEQASSEQTARHKASLVGGRLLLDLTGGMGVDAWAFAERVERVVYVEQQPDLARLAQYNLARLGRSNVAVQTGDGLAFLAGYAGTADWLYLDPARRDDAGGRVSRLADCEPNLLQPGVLPALLAKTERILLKTSPLLDIDQTIRQLPTTQAVHVVAVGGEVRELLFVLGQLPTAPEAVAMVAVNVTPAGSAAIRFRRDDERTADVRFGDPARYLYEPNAAVLKAGAFRWIAAQFGVQKLAPHSHLYTSDVLRVDFPGRAFLLERIIRPDRAALRHELPALKANLTVRNFPQTVAELRKQLNLSEGGDTYIFATTLLNGDKRLLISRKLN